MSVINSDEWIPFRRNVVQNGPTYEAEVMLMLALLDLARYSTIQWFPKLELDSN